ncbi:MAG: transcriptional regulator NrdR [Parcubacteria group bacterium Gr01-1014_13]|nr:MAG: transcriptional regulator NrdR [Parcubacteria group bacterium Gr01-1014_13]
MRCPVCNNREISVVDTRPSEDDLSIRRRRECDKCQSRFSTVEEMELLDVIVVKSDGHREIYMRDKLESGIKMALTKRSYTRDNFHRLIHSIERDIQRKKSKEISSKELGEVVIKHLRSFDKVAYIRFASVYRDFRDVRTFEKELKKLGAK